MNKIEINTLCGLLYIVSDKEGVRRVSWCPNKKKSGENILKYSFEKMLLTKLNNFFNRQREDFDDIPLHIDGTDFERKVWGAIRTIPYGETKTYSDIADIIGEENAYRAVGNTCGKNFVPVIIPCHRVIRKDRSIGGFSSGEKIKKFLLKLERINFQSPENLKNPEKEI